MQQSLNKEQWQAVCHVNGPLLVLAGAGSGKTRIVTYRIAHLIENNIAPDEILALTFTNKAAGEMLHRITQLVTVGVKPLISTFHSLGVRVLRESIHHLGYKNDFFIYDEDDSEKLLKKCMESLSIKNEEAKAARFLISHAKNNLLSTRSELEALEAPPLLKKQLHQLFTLYQERLKEANALDFDDLLFLPLLLFQKAKDVLEYYQNRWRYLLIDEYQDTNTVQYLLARLLVEKTQNIFVVGDPDQSIYSWRGANIQNIMNFEKDYPGAKTVRLEQNYRSKKNILDAANALIEHNRNRFKKNLWSALGAGEQIQLFVGGCERQEAGFVVNEIEKLSYALKIPLKEMAIFYRTNFQSRTFEDYLLRKALPYVIVGGISFYQRKEIKDILSFLRLIESDQDIVAFARTINLPKRGIGDVTLEKIYALSLQKKCSFLEALQQVLDGNQSQLRVSEKQKEGFKSYLQLIFSLRKIAPTLSLQRLVSETIKMTGYLEILREDQETFEDRKANLEELVSKAAEWEFVHEAPTLSLFLEELSLASAIDRSDLNNDKVNLMTIHNGKGLEFKVVFLVGLEEDLFPHVNARGDYEAVEEERRLCYVGMTRAKERLYLTAAETRFIYGSSRAMRPSRFLREIPKDSYKKVMY